MKSLRGGSENFYPSERGALKKLWGGALQKCVYFKPKRGGGGLLKN